MKKCVVTPEIPYNTAAYRGGPASPKIWSLILIKPMGFSLERKVPLRRAGDGILEAC